MQKIIQLFEQQAVLEVQTPTLLDTPTSYVYIDSISLSVNADISVVEIFIKFAKCFLITNTVSAILMNLLCLNIIAWVLIFIS